MHSAAGGQIFIFPQHLQKLVFADLSFSPLFLVTCFLQLGNVFKIVLLFIADFKQLPAVIIFAQFDAGVPFGADPDEFLLEECHKLTFDDLCFRKDLFLLKTTFLSILSSLLFQLQSVLLDLIWQLPLWFSGHSIVVKLFALGSAILFPVGMLKDLLGGFEALRHFILRLFGGSVVVIGGAVDGFMDGPYFSFLFEGDWMVHI